MAGPFRMSVLPPSAAHRQIDTAVLDPLSLTAGERETVHQRAIEPV